MRTSGMTSDNAIKRCTSAADVANHLASSIIEPEQWWRILAHTDVAAWTRALTQNKIAFAVHPTHIMWLGQHIRFEWLHRRTIICLRRLLTLQRQRKTFFKTHVSQTYTVHYDRCTLNGIFEHGFDRQECWKNVVRFSRHEAAFAASKLSQDQRKLIGL